MSTLADYGPLVHSVDVDRGVIRYLQRWMPTYIRQAERREGRPSHFFAIPVAYATLYSEDESDDFFSDRRLPVVFVTAGEATNWMRDGEGNYSATFVTRITTVTRARNRAEARYRASVYCGVVTELLLARSSLEGVAGGVRVVSERPRPLIDPSNRQRVLAAGFGEYQIFVPNVRAIRHGPYTPDPPPDPDAAPDPMPSVSSVQVSWDGVSPPTSLQEED